MLSALCLAMFLLLGRCSAFRRVSHASTSAFTSSSKGAGQRNRKGGFKGRPPKHDAFSHGASSSERAAPDLHTTYLVAPPLKVMTFIDGTWLYYTLIEGRENCPIQRRFGVNWKKTHRVDYTKLVQIIAANLKQQLLQQSGASRLLDMVRSHVFTSIRDDSEADSHRVQMVSAFHASNFNVRLFSTDGRQEKCVDISLAVEMLYMATVVGAYDMAVIVTGDKDFLPAMEKTRLMAKRVALASMRNSCNRDLVAPEQNVRDFDVIWIDDYIDQYIVERSVKIAPEVAGQLVALIESHIADVGGSVTSRELGRFLQSTYVDKLNAHALLKEGFGNLTGFLQRHKDRFATSFKDDQTEFNVTVKGKAEVVAAPSVEKSGGYFMASNDQLRMSLSQEDVSDALDVAGDGSASASELDMLQRALGGEESAGDEDHFKHFGIADMSRIAESLKVSSSPVDAARNSSEEDSEISNSAVNIIRFQLEIAELEGDVAMSSREIGRLLQARNIGDADEQSTLLSCIKHQFGGLKTFIARYPQYFVLSQQGSTEFFVSLAQGQDESELAFTDERDSVGSSGVTTPDTSTQTVLSVDAAPIKQKGRKPSTKKSSSTATKPGSSSSESKKRGPRKTAAVVTVTPAVVA